MKILDDYKKAGYYVYQIISLFFVMIFMPLYTYYNFSFWYFLIVVLICVSLVISFYDKQIRRT